MRVLFTGGGGAGSQALWDLLHDRYEIAFADPDPARIPPNVPRARAHFVQMATSGDFLSSVMTLCRQESIDLLVPGVDEELAQLADHRDAFGATKLMSPESTYIRTMLDKFDTAQALSDAGLRAPETQLLHAGVAWRDFPCIVKPRVGRGSRGVSVVENAEALAGQANSLRELASGYVVQELIAGQEYSVQVIANDKAELQAVFPARIDIKRGITLRATGEENAAVVAAVVAIHRALPASGSVNVQGILTAEGEFVVFEINPRISTTLCLGVASGLDPIALFAADGPADPLVEFESGLTLERYWNNHFTRMSNEASND